MSSRADVVADLAARIIAIRKLHPLCVAIDGVDAAGKTTLADELETAIVRLGRPVIRASIDGFHRSRQARYQRGPLSPEGYYLDSFDYERLKEVLLDPWRRGGSRPFRRAMFDSRSDRPVDASPETASDDAVLLFDGVFLQRPELAGCFDFVIFVHADFAETLRRAEHRDTELLGGVDQVRQRYLARYIPGQELYLAAVSPERRASAVVDNNDVSAPVMFMRGQRIDVSAASPTVGTPAQTQEPDLMAPPRPISPRFGLVVAFAIFILYWIVYVWLDTLGLTNQFITWFLVIEACVLAALWPRLWIQRWRDRQLVRNLRSWPAPYRLAVINAIAPSKLWQLGPRAMWHGDVEERGVTTRFSFSPEDQRLNRLTMWMSSAGALCVGTISLLSDSAWIRVVGAIVALGLVVVSVLLRRRSASLLRIFDVSPFGLIEHQPDGSATTCPWGPGVQFHPRRWDIRFETPAFDGSPHIDVPSSLVGFRLFVDLVLRHGGFQRPSSGEAGTDSAGLPPTSNPAAPLA